MSYLKFLANAFAPCDPESFPTDAQITVLEFHAIFNGKRPWNTTGTRIIHTIDFLSFHVKGILTFCFSIFALFTSTPPRGQLSAWAAWTSGIFGRVRTDGRHTECPNCWKLYRIRWFMHNIMTCLSLNFLTNLWFFWIGEKKCSNLPKFHHSIKKRRGKFDT